MPEITLIIFVIVLFAILVALCCQFGRINEAYNHLTSATGLLLRFLKKINHAEDDRFLEEMFLSRLNIDFNDNAQRDIDNIKETHLKKQEELNSSVKKVFEQSMSVYSTENEKEAFEFLEEKINKCISDFYDKQIRWK